MRNRLYIFGGYDGIQRLNDFYYFVLSEKKSQIDVPQSSLLADMKSWVCNPNYSDVVLVLEAENGRQVPAHKLLLQRCDFKLKSLRV